MSPALHVLHVNSCFNQKFSEKNLIHKATVELAELCKETRLRTIISASPYAVLRVLFAVLSISYHRTLFEKKTEKCWRLFCLQAFRRTSSIVETWKLMKTSGLFILNVVMQTG